MATKYQVATEFSILDRASAQLKKMSAAGSAVGGAWNRSVAAAQARVDAFGRSVAAAGKMAVGIGIGAAAAGLVAATKQYADFEGAIRAAGAAYGPAFTNAADFEDKLKEMSSATRAVAAATEFDATQAGRAMETLAKAGVNASQAVGLLPGVADLATAACVNMDDAVALAIGSLNTMGMMSDDPAKLAANMTRLSDVMTYTANSAYMSIQDVSAAISAGGSFFKTASNNLNVMSGSLTALAANSIKGAEAGVHLRNIMVNLSSPTAAASAALKAMNIQTTDAAGNLLPLPKIIGQMNKAMAGMGDVQRNANLYDIFGKQNIAAVTALLNTGEDALNKYAQAAANSMGAVSAAAQAQRGGLMNQFKVLQSALTELGFKFVEAFKGKGSDAIRQLTEAVSNFDPQPLINSLITAVDVVSGFVKAAWAMRYVIGSLVGIFVLWRTVTTAAALAIGAYHAGVAVATAVQMAYGIAIKGSSAASAAFTFATTGTKIAVTALSAVMSAAKFVIMGVNAAFAANPIGFVLVAVTALVGIILVMTNRWKQVTLAVDGFFAKISNMQGIGGAILQFLARPFEIAWKMIRSVFDIFAAFKEGGFINGIKMLGLAILQFIAAPIQNILKMLSFIPGIGKLSAGIDNWFQNTRDSLLGTAHLEKTPAAEKGGAAAAMGIARQQAAANAMAAQPATDAASAMAAARKGQASQAAMAGGLPRAGDNGAASAAPTATAAQANSYSRSESVTTNRLEVGLADGLEVKNGSAAAPNFTLYTGGR